MLISLVRECMSEADGDQRQSQGLDLVLEASRGREKWCWPWSWWKNHDIFKTLINDNTEFITSNMLTVTLQFLLTFQWFTVKLMLACNFFSLLQHLLCIVTYTGSRRCMGEVISGICDFVHLCVLAVKGKRLELSAPKLGTHILCGRSSVMHWPGGKKANFTGLWSVLLAWVCMSIWLLRFLVRLHHYHGEDYCFCQYYYYYYTFSLFFLRFPPNFTGRDTSGTLLYWPIFIDLDLFFKVTDPF